jgi:hypothetical protein
MSVASPRDNVVFESGLFGAVFGWRRSMIVHARGVKLPTDLLGLTVISYDSKADPAAEGRLVAARVKRVIDELGWRGSESLAGRMEGHWWQFSLSDATGIEKSALALIEIERTNRTVHALSGRTWTAEGELVAQFQSKATALNEEARTLFYYWEGEWPGRADVPQFYGKGEIVLVDAQLATGYFTVRSDGNPELRERKSVRYRRANAEEIEALKSPDAQQRRDQIQKQLEERRNQIFAG